MSLSESFLSFLTLISFLPSVCGYALHIASSSESFVADVALISSLESAFVAMILQVANKGSTLCVCGYGTSGRQDE